MLNVFGGKITTYRRLAEAALARLAPLFEDAGRPWTADAPLPGGDFPWNGFVTLVDDLRAATPRLEPRIARRLVRAYGTDAAHLLAGATKPPTSAATSAPA